jgi:hypothetical protein
MSGREENADRPDGGVANEEEPQVREAQEAHGGSMAPGLVDETGHPVASAPVVDDE